MNILVTGATRGIGKSIAEYLDNYFTSAKIFATGRNTELLNQYKNHFVCDFSIHDDVMKLGGYIKSNNIDVLINNAGEYIYSELEKTEFSHIHKLVQVNFETPLYLTSCAIPYMKSQKWGRIINIGSISGVMGEACASVYSGTKSALIGFTKALALETAEYGITVNTINPGWVNTDMGNCSANESDWTKEEITDCIPQKRFVEPAEIAAMVKYLISDEAKGVTGQSINLCAGLSVGY